MLQSDAAQRWPCAACVPIARPVFCLSARWLLVRAGTAGVVGRGGSRGSCLSRQHASMRQQRWPTTAKEGGPQQPPVHMTDPSPYACGSEVPPATRTSTQRDVFHCEVCHEGAALRMVVGPEWPGCSVPWRSSCTQFRWRCEGSSYAPGSIAIWHHCSSRSAIPPRTVQGNGC